MPTGCSSFANIILTTGTPMFATLKRYLGRTRGDRPVQEARQQRMGKSAKVQTQFEHGLVSGIDDLDEDDRWSAQTYRDWKVFGIKPTEGRGRATNNDRIVCDDMNIHVDAPKGNVVTLLIVAALIGGSLWWMGKLPAMPSDSPSGPLDSEYEIRFYDKDGNLIDVPRRQGG